VVALTVLATPFWVMGRNRDNTGVPVAPGGGGHDHVQFVNVSTASWIPADDSFRAIVVLVRRRAGEAWRNAGSSKLGSRDRDR
jgi:hypothetical protein